MFVSSLASQVMYKVCKNTIFQKKEQKKEKISVYSLNITSSSKLNYRKKP